MIKANLQKTKLRRSLANMRSVNIHKMIQMKPSIYRFSEQYNKKTLDNVADTFVKNLQYRQRMKQRDIEEDYEALKRDE